jgi:hypothetical protein
VKSFKNTTKNYVNWLGTKVTLVPQEIEKRYQKTAESTPFEFLRATFYRWTQQWSEVDADFNNKDVPLVLGVGDLHAENFGTWRDAEGRLVWGVNDFDECCYLPYTNDLVRLATSVRFAIEEQAISGLQAVQKLSKKDRSEYLQKHYNELQDEVKEQVNDAFSTACKLILAGYCDGLGVEFEDDDNSSKHYVGRKPFVLAEEHDWLREIVLNKLREEKGDSEDDFDKFFTESYSLPYVNNPVPRSAWEALRLAMPEPELSFRIGLRDAGLGSLGRQRFTAIVNDWQGGILVREIKSLAPSAWTWWDQERQDINEIFYDEVLRQAVRARDPWIRIHLSSPQNNWIVRRLAPDSDKVKLKDLPKDKAVENQLWRAMGREVANVHLPIGDVWADLQKRNQDKTWLKAAAEKMADELLKDWENRATVLKLLEDLPPD